MAACWTLQWRAGQEPVPVETAEELALRLREAEGDALPQPLVVELRSPGGGSLTIGLGGGVSIATFALSVDPPYFVSRGSEENSTPLVFFRDGHWTEFSAENGIPVGVAIEAAQEFLATGERPRRIEWEEV